LLRTGFGGGPCKGQDQHLARRIGAGGCGEGSGLEDGDVQVKRNSLLFLFLLFLFLLNQAATERNHGKEW
jgi:hypothetical protein